MRTRAQRAVLAQNCAARQFQMFAEPSSRGVNWTLETMPRLISGYVRTQAFLYNVPERHRDQMVIDALAFYREFLAPAMAVLASR